MFETETVRSCLVQKLKWEEGGHGHGPLPPQWLRHCTRYCNSQCYKNFLCRKIWFLIYYNLQRFPNYIMTKIFLIINNLYENLHKNTHCKIPNPIVQFSVKEQFYVLQTLKIFFYCVIQYSIFMESKKGETSSNDTVTVYQRTTKSLTSIQ